MDSSLLFERHPHPSWIYDLETLRFLAVNRAAVEHYGYSEAEFLEMTLEDLRPEDDVPALKSNVAEVTEGIDQAGVWRHYRKNGELIYVEITSQTLTYNDCAAEVVVAVDTTEKVRAERALKENKQLLEMACDLGKLGAWSVDVPNFEHMWSDQARAIHEVDRGVTLTLEQLMEFYVGASRELVAQVFQRCVEEGEPFDEELKMVSAKGNKRWVRAIGAAVRDGSGKVIRVQGAIQDLSESHAMKEQMLRAQRMQSIGTLAGGIAHDLNNLMAPILMGTGLLKELEPTPQARNILREIERSAQRSADLVKQVLTFARGTTGERTAVPIAQLVEDLGGIVRNTFPKKIEWVVEQAETNPPVIGDPTQIHQVLINLCVNARDAMPNGGTLKVGFTHKSVDDLYAAANEDARPGEFLRIEVSDTGMGMSGKVKERIFEPFFTTKQTGEGSGLGLSTAIGIVRSHGGFITVYSEPRKGTEFHVYLPLETGAGTEAATASESAEEEGALPCGQGQRILVVDDEEAVLNTTAVMLESYGYEVVKAPDGIDAMAAYARQMGEIDLVLTDLMMPNMDGPSLIAALQRINPELPIVAASGLEANGRFLKVTQMGIRYFINKPCSTRELLTTLAEALKSSEPDCPPGGDR